MQRNEEEGRQADGTEQREPSASEKHRHAVETHPQDAKGLGTAVSS